MKKSIIAAVGLSVLLFSCKKDTQTTVTEPTQIGTTTLTGNIQIAQASGSNAPAVGATVSVSIPNKALYPQSPSAQGTTVSSGKTDANGNYSIAVTTTGGANGTGVTAVAVVSPVAGTYDPINGTTGIYSGNNSGNINFTPGIPVTYNTTLSTFTPTGANVTGTATVLGKVYVQYIIEGPVGVYNPGNVALANATVYLNFSKDPTTQQSKLYTATTDANGNYSFTINTTNASGFNDNGTIYVNNFVHAQDTIHVGGVEVAGVPGYFGGYSNNISGLTPNAVSNEWYFYYGPCCNSYFSPN